MSSTVILVDTPQGPGRLFVDLAEQPSSILVLGHGAGGGVGAVDLELLTRNLPAIGTSVVKFEQPWRTAGARLARRRPAGRSVVCCAGGLVGQEWAKHQLLVGGRSGRRSSGLSDGVAHKAGGNCCAWHFPLHLPGRPTSPGWRSCWH